MTTNRSAGRVFRFEIALNTWGIVTVFTDGSILVATPVLGHEAGIKADVPADVVDTLNPTTPWKVGPYTVGPYTVARACLWSARYQNARVAA